jgi:hypothetical protein
MISKWGIGKTEERSDPGLVWGTVTAFVVENLTKPRKPSCSSAGMQATIWTWDLPNKKQESCSVDHQYLSRWSEITIKLQAVDWHTWSTGLDGMDQSQDQDSNTETSRISRYSSLYGALLQNIFFWPVVYSVIFVQFISLFFYWQPMDSVLQIERG